MILKLVPHFRVIWNFCGLVEPNQRKMVDTEEGGILRVSARAVCCLKGMPMRSDMVHPEADSGSLSVQQVIYEAAADVEEGLEFWKTIVGNIPSKHRVSRKVLNHQG